MVSSWVGRFQRWAWLCILIAAALSTPFRARFQASPWMLSLVSAVVLLVGSVAILHPFEELPWKVALRGVAVGGSLMILTPVELWPLLIGALVGSWTLDLCTLRLRVVGEPAPETDLSPLRRPAAPILLGVAALSFAFAMVQPSGLRQTAALFFGLPTLLGLIAVYAASQRSLTGTILRATTLGLVIAAMLWPKGVVYLLLASPLAYGLGTLAGRTFERGRMS